MKRILVATDGSLHGSKAVEIGGQLAGMSGAQLMILHVAAQNPLSPHEMNLVQEWYGETLRDRLAAYAGALPEDGSIADILRRETEVAGVVREVIGKGILEAGEAVARREGARSVETILESGDPAATILSIARYRSADVIVLGCRGFSELKSLIMGSVSEKVLHGADCTVMIAKLPAQAPWTVAS